VATGQNFPDALAVAPLAGYWAAPVLTVTTNSLPAATKTEIQRLDPDFIVILGGTGAVSASVASALNAITPTSRIAGANRYETAVFITARLESQPRFAFAATGMNYPDALAGGAVAYASRGAPILLVMQSSVPSVTASEFAQIDPRRIYVLGGTGAISAGVMTQLAGYATGP